jgi:IS6 family transposase
MASARPTLFKGRHFQDRVIVLCVRWYLRYCLTLRDLEEMMAERGLRVDHSSIGRWVLRYAPELYQRIRRELRFPNRSWRVDETLIKVRGQWKYLYRAVDSTGETIDFLLSEQRDAAARLFHGAGHEAAHGVTLPAHALHQFADADAALALQ